MLEQLSEAWGERDIERMTRLLEQPRAGASAAQETRYGTFRSLLLGAQAEVAGFANRGFRLVSDRPADGGRTPPDLELDESVSFRVVLAPAPGQGFTLRARKGGAKTTLLVTVSIEDTLEDGSRVVDSVPFQHELERDVEIVAATPFELPVPDTTTPGPHVKIRRLEFSGVVFVAGIEQDGAAIPLAKIPLEPLVLHLFPKGFRPTRQKPLATLKNALLRPADYKTHLLVASWFIGRDGDAATKQEATGRLIELLRTGPASCEATGRACLLAIVGEEAPGQRDREGWLRWYAMRQRPGGRGR